MSRSLKSLALKSRVGSCSPLMAGVAILSIALLAVTEPARAQDDITSAGAAVFKRCAACHSVGAGAGHKIGPQLNDLFGRTAGTTEGYKYSRAMANAGEAGLVWNDETLGFYLLKPNSYVKGTKMSFGGLSRHDDRRALIAYLKTFTAGTSEHTATNPSPPAGTQLAAAVVPANPAEPPHGTYNLGRRATEEEIVAWDIDVRPDGQGLPEGKGTVAEGEVIFSERCATCHGDFGEGVDRWPVLAGGHDSLKSDRPEKTIGSYWPYLSTVFDYVHRAMPFGDAQSLQPDETYAVVAYLLYLNDVVTDEEFELSKANFTSVRLPNEGNFYMDDRDQEPWAKGGDPCMTNCMPEPAKLRMRARILDVTPDEAEGKGAIE